MFKISITIHGDSDVGDIIMLVTEFFRYVKSVTNIPKSSPTYLVSNIRHQHRCNRIHSKYESYYMIEY